MITHLCYRGISETLIRRATRMTHVMFDIDKVKLDKEKDEYSCRRCIYGANLGFAVLGLVSKPVHNKGHPFFSQKHLPEFVD